MWPTNNKVKPLLLLVIYWMALNYLVLHADISFFNIDKTEAIETVAFNQSSQIPASNADWQPVKLPDYWRSQHENARNIWYRAYQPIDQPGEQLWSIYLPAVTHNAAVYINGTWVGQGGAFGDQVSRHHNEPLLFSFSADQLVKGINRIDIRVEASSYLQGMLGAFYLAPQDILKPAYQFKYFVRITVAQWMTAAVYGLALMVFAFWLARPQDSIYGLFALELFFWSTHNLNLFVTEIPVPAILWEAMTMSTWGWTVVVMIFFNHRYVKDGNNTVEKFLKVFAVMGLGLFLLPSIEDILIIGYGIWDVFLVVFGSYALIHLLRVYLKRGESDVYWMMVVGLPILVFGLHDIMVLNQLIDQQQGLIVQYSVMPAVILFSWFLVRRFVESINRAESLAANLEIRVEQKTEELKTQYGALQVLQKQQVLSEERERIMRDMHDGIGGQLLSVLAYLHDYSGDAFDHIRRKVQGSVTDLRFVIDSLDPLHNELPVLLGMLRSHLQDQLDSAGIELEWAVEELPELPELTPGHSLHLMRIVQEAITNAIKHSNSKKMRIAAAVSDNNADIVIDVIDFAGGSRKPIETSRNGGQGIDNMKHRAEQIGGELSVDINEQGCRVRLRLQL